MKTPRVLQVALSLHPGGTERLVLELTKRLPADVSAGVCCIDDEGAWASELTSRGVPVSALRRRPGFQPSLGRAIAGLAGDLRANVVHCHHYSPLVYGCLARAWRPGLRVVFTEHGRLSDAKPSARRRLVNQVLARVPDAAFAVSRELREYLVEEGFPSSRIDVIHNGIDIGPPPPAELRHTVRQRLDVDEKTFVIGTVARLDPVKDLATLIRAFSEAALADALLVVVGDGSEREALQALAAELGVGSAVRFLGQRNDARDWLAGCDAYVNSSISEGVSLTILEAMAAGLPVIATRVGGTPEVVTDECAHLVPARSPGVLAAALRALARDTSARQRLGLAGRQRVERHFSLDRMVNDYRSVYERVV